MSILDMLVIVGVSFTLAAFFMLVMMALGYTKGEKCWKPIVVTLLMVLIGFVFLLFTVPKVNKECQDEREKNIQNAE